jgi:hypothetical protein
MSRRLATILLLVGTAAMVHVGEVATPATPATPTATLSLPVRVALIAAGVSLVVAVRVVLRSRRSR